MVGTDLGGELTGLVIGEAVEVHRELGPGLLESICEECLTCELQRQGLSPEEWGSPSGTILRALCASAVNSN